ncbi:Release factor glutamine methyltransferase [Ewingella americana]|uniref:Release factor glutamine methyltransferase n=1 Tax=Ewingella americana TaxID=41202 RepID=A0A377NCU5_9GAMM|nr:Release factor glutamine methyltransferase [Ewingella americana]
MDFQHWLRDATRRLSAGESPKRDAEILLGFVTGRSRTFIMAFGETSLTASELEELEALLARREQGEPVAYLVGEREFWSLPLSVSPATLIPVPILNVWLSRHCCVCPLRRKRYWIWEPAPAP